MKEFALNGQKRETVGKKASRLLRKEGLVPCNIYGEHKEDGKPAAHAFAIPMAELRKVIYTPHIYMMNLNIDGVHHKAVIKELQFHPVKDTVLHVDFYEVNEEKPLTIGIPVKLNGLAQGVRDGGKLNLSIRKLNVTAPYKQIPEVLDIDVTGLELGKSIKVRDLSFEGLELATPADVVVCSVKATRASRSAAAADADAAGE
ncbi:MAG: 50S ribosomal protein L25/general stress protein Ctc [Prevotella sp.]|jgi:large subunit ribosomal protein L25|nr:50S ribosomal protein L25/general stress protein Ctc [Prevotella sp.]